MKCFYKAVTTYWSIVMYSTLGNEYAKIAEIITQIKCEQGEDP